MTELSTRMAGIARCRSRLIAEQVPSREQRDTGPIYPASNYGSGRDQVRQGEADVDQGSGSPLAVSGAFVIATDDLSLRADDPGTPYPSDRIHFGTLGQLELGSRMASQIHDHLTLP